MAKDKDNVPELVASLALLKELTVDPAVNSLRIAQEVDRAIALADTL